MDKIDEKIRSVVQAIIKEVHPVQIILFGSAARGDLDANSDIDFLVVMPDGTHKRQTAHLLYKKIRGVGIPFDILVATPSLLTKHKDNAGLIYKTILSEGKQVYAA